MSRHVHDVNERPLRQSLADEMLAEVGYEPAGFDSSIAALQVFRAEPQRFNLMLTDETMAPLPGTELTRDSAATARYSNRPQERL